MFSLVENLAGLDPAVFGQNLHDGVGRNGLSGTGLSDDTEGLAPVEVERYAIYRIDGTAVRMKAGVQVLNREDGLIGNAGIQRRGLAFRGQCSIYVFLIFTHWMNS